MRRALSLAGALAIAAGAAQTASAAIVFSNVNITGSISAPNTVTTGPDDIDIAFSSPAGVVGDAVAPTRAGNIVITFNVTSTSGGLTQDIASILGAVTGSGIIIFNEVIEDLVTPGIIGSASIVIDAANPPPRSRVIEFSRPSTNFKVKKTFFFFAPDTQAVDLAQLSLVEQRFVPTPGAAALLGLAGLATLRRRR